MPIRTDFSLALTDLKNGMVISTDVLSYFIPLKSVKYNCGYKEFTIDDLNKNVHLEWVYPILYLTNSDKLKLIYLEDISDNKYTFKITNLLWFNCSDISNIEKLSALMKRDYWITEPASTYHIDENKKCTIANEFDTIVLFNKDDFKMPTPESFNVSSSTPITIKIDEDAVLKNKLDDLDKYVNDNITKASDYFNFYDKKLKKDNTKDEYSIKREEQYKRIKNNLKNAFDEGMNMALNLTDETLRDVAEIISKNAEERKKKGNK